MPKRHRSNKYSNYSSVATHQGFGQEEAWDDTELINQFDEALREWKKEKENVFYNYENDSMESEEAPQMGEWVEVIPEKFNPESAAENSGFVSTLDDMEMMALYEEGLREWKEERLPENWGNSMDDNIESEEVGLGVVSVTTVESLEDEDSTPGPGPWVVVNREDELETLRNKALAYSQSQLAANANVDTNQDPGANEEREILTVYDEALQEWREERQSSVTQDESQGQGQEESTSISNQPPMAEPFTSDEPPSNLQNITKQLEGTNISEASMEVVA